jgi:hypothetical protein
MSFQEAKAYLQDGLDSLIERVEQGREQVAPNENQLPKEQWQTRTTRYVEQAARRLWTPAGAACLEYLRARGLQDRTIKAAQLGYVEEEEDGELIPRLVIPWHAGDGQYWAVNRRDLRNPLPKGAARYKMTAWSNKKAMYGCRLLARPRRYLTFVVEGEIDALILAQEARGLPVNVVASGGDGMPAVKWLVRLSRMPSVLLSQDHEKRGDEIATKWMDALNGDAIRYRPLAKDVNAMLLEGWSVRTWVEAALDMLPAREDQAAPVEQVASAPAGGDDLALDARVIAALPGAPGDLQEDVAALLSLLDQDQAATWLEDAGRAWSARAQAALYEYAEQVSYPGGLFLERAGLQVEQIAPAIHEDQAQESGPLQLEQPATDDRDQDGAAFLDQVNALVNSAGAWPDGFTLQLHRSDSEFVRSIQALPDQIPARPGLRSTLPPLPRVKCPGQVHTTVDIPGETKKNRSMTFRECGARALAHGWCEQHKHAALLLDMGAALGYPRVEVSPFNIIPAGMTSWEGYAVGTGDQAMKAALPRVKRLLDKARDQDQAAS